MSTSTQSDSAAKKDVTKLQRAIVDGLEDVKAQDIQVFNTEHLSPLFERVIIASGASSRQTKALASSVREAVKKAGFAVPRHEGEENGEWIIVDCGQCVVHVMQPTIRQYYRLEEIWGDKPVRLKLGAAKPSKIFASEDASQEAKPAKRSAAKKTAAAIDGKVVVKKAASKKAATQAAAAADKPVAAKKPAAKKPAAKSAATAKPAVKKPAAKKAAAPAKTVVVKPMKARGAAGRTASADKAPAKRAARTAK
ncbi:ribosome silencing factor [Comamonas avium]|uniref:Ribosomal silencing factor RsfS n=1 Tax=Comamonas avium TaxID=2762231 RepID=A0ABR8SEI2_9BURK|nr:ribosome silencing factor [Comamonas avium]MBD7961897.1 ribosome silencing factor [Comamonas avium]